MSDANDESEAALRAMLATARHFRNQGPMEVNTFAHCRQCITELPVGESPRTYARLEVGLTPTGAIIWCVRHESEVVRIEVERAPSLRPTTHTTMPS